jgi:3-dehydroquinate dehydratase / shikimate dehydrogenase
MEIVASYVPIAGQDPLQEIVRPPAGATMVELRADLLSGETPLETLVNACPLPVVLTLRSTAEGGRGPDDLTVRRAFFAAAAPLRVALVDLEAGRDSELLDAVVPRERVVLSAHVGVQPPADLERTAAALLARGTRYAKVVAPAENLTDVLAVLRLAQAFDRGAREERRAVVFASGEAGRATRLLSPWLAAPLAYAAWADGRAAAAGQYLPAELLSLAGHLQGRPRRLFAVLGKTVGGSLSPWMHNAAFRALGLQNLFVPLEVSEEDDLDELLRAFGDTCFDRAGLTTGGFAVTMPWKEQAARRCDLLAPRAQRASAANTVLPRPAKVVGDLTDIDGITRVLRESGAQLGGARALVLGTGGAARAAVVALQLEGASVAVAGRDPGKAAGLATRLGAQSVDASEAERVSVVVNATPAGADGELSAWLDGLRAPAGSVVVDMPYGTSPTFLAGLASRRGWDYVGGREVLLYQGVAQFAAMNQMAPPVRAMAAALGLEEVQA